MTRGGASNLDRPAPGKVWACPDCDRAGQLRERKDSTVKCYDCGAVTKRKRRLVQRPDETHELTTDERQRGGGHADAEFMQAIASLPRNG